MLHAGPAMQDTKLFISMSLALALSINNKQQ